MNKMAYKAERFFTENTLWIFLTLLMFMSYLMLLSVLKDNWFNFISAFLKLSLIFSPVLLFAYFRKQLMEKMSFNLLAIIWVLCFILVPGLLALFCERFMDFLIQNHQYSFKPPGYFVFAQSFLLTTSGVLLATELVLLGQNYYKEKLKQPDWAKYLSIDKMLLIVVVILALFAAAVGTFRVKDLGYNTGTFWWLKMTYKFIVFSFQFIIINMVYYFYYYINKKVLIPKIFKKKGMIFYGFSLAAVILVFYPLFIFLMQNLPVSNELSLQWFQPGGKTFTSDGGGFPFLIMLLSVPVIISNEWFRQSNEIVSLEKEKSATELNLLKQQINPHFFFNTLNNLYALSITKDKQTPEVILQLSELMRYVIYRGKEDFVELKEEVQYIEDYIQLQQIRLHKKLDFKFKKNIADDNRLIPPLLFITFVENAFKHGIEPAEGNCHLHLSLTSDEYGLTFTCKNSVEESDDTEVGIGLTNLKRRMELRYPNKHHVITSGNQTEFHSSLKLSF